MRHFGKWFIMAFVGATTATSCVDEIKFGDSFLEKAPSVAVTQDSICGILTVNCITGWLLTGMMWTEK